MGWVGDGVLYARFHGDLHSSLGVAHAGRLEQLLLGESKRVRYFVDASALKSCDLLARSAMVRVLLANRSRLTGVSLLIADDAARQSAANLLTALGDLLDVSPDPVEFHGRLLRAAPFASHRLNPRQSGTARPVAPTPRTR